MKTIRIFFATIGTTAALAAGAMQFVGHMLPTFPDINGPSIAKLAKSKTPPVAAPTPTPKKGGGAKGLVGGPLGKTTAVGAGIYISGKFVPLQMNGTGDCYVEDPIQGNIHMPCDEAKKAGGH